MIKVRDTDRKKIPKNIFDVSSATRASIVVRLGCGCSNCRWNEAACDIHHIVSVAKGGTNDHENLTVLCPNCHRLAHNGKIVNLVSFKDQVGDSWLEHYDGNRAQNNLIPIGRRKEKS